MMSFNEMSSHHSHHNFSLTKSPILTQTFASQQQTNEFSTEFNAFPSSNDFNAHGSLEFGTANLMDFNQSSAYFDVNAFHQGNLGFMANAECNNVSANSQLALFNELEWRNSDLALTGGYHQPPLNYFHPNQAHHHQYPPEFQFPLNNTSTTEHSSSSLESQDTTTASTVSPNSSNAMANNSSPLPQQNPIQETFSVHSLVEENSLNNQENQEISIKDDLKLKEPKLKTITQQGERKVGAKRPGRKPHASLNRPKKPEDTYIMLIAEAIKGQESKRATLNEIYDYLKGKYEFFNGPYNGWQNSIRHNLSLNQCFMKLNKTAGNSRAGKGHYWAINPKHPITKPNNQQVLEVQSRIKTPTTPKRKLRVAPSQKTAKVPRNFANLSEADKQMLDRFSTEPQFNSLFDTQHLHSNNNTQMIQSWESSQMSSSLLLNDFNNYMLTAPQHPQFYSSAFCWPSLNNSAANGQLIEGSAIENPTGLLIPANASSNAHAAQQYHFVNPKMESLNESQSSVVEHFSSNVDEMEEQQKAVVNEEEVVEKKIKLEQIPTIDSLYPNTTTNSSNNTSSNSDALMPRDSLHLQYPLSEFGGETSDFLGFAHQQTASNFHPFDQLPSQDFLNDEEDEEEEEEEENGVRYEVDVEDGERNGY